MLWDIESDPVLAGTKLIAEAWDAAGLYQVGSFVGDSWKEWNGRFRDDVRDFFRGDRGLGQARRRPDGRAARRFTATRSAKPEQSVNFVTCHDGFTLNDLVSYNDKHNEANGEENRDGANDNRSWNCGVEGPSDDPAVEKLRNRQVKNFLTVTLLSLGVPMILMGDEVRRTQGGNNNAYCQDNETSWFDWTLLKKHADVHRFLKLLIARRLLRGTEHERQRLSLNRLIQEANKAWHGVKLNQPDWSDHSRSVAFAAETSRRRHRVLHHPERVLGAARLRTAGRRRGSRTRGGGGSTPPTRRPNDIVPWRRGEGGRAIRAPITWGRARWWCCFQREVGVTRLR